MFQTRLWKLQKAHSMHRRHLKPVWNRGNNTNIVELYSHITKSDTQLTYYSSGLGTVAQISDPSLRDDISNTLDMAIGRNLHKVIIASYRWLSDNYRDGDSIFLFGFSRGAYQVRALVGMIARVGLLLPGNKEQLPL